MAAAFSPSTIEYRPLWWLDEIRLVILEPGSASDPIRCRLIHTELKRSSFSGSMRYVSTKQTCPRGITKYV
jgi:hypothetical protein